MVKKKKEKAKEKGFGGTQHPTSDRKKGRPKNKWRVWKAKLNLGPWRKQHGSRLLALVRTPKGKETQAIQKTSGLYKTLRNTVT